MSERTPMEALRSALRFAASRSCITSAEELAIMDAWNNNHPQPAEAPASEWPFVWDTGRLDAAFRRASEKHGHLETLIAVAAEGVRIAEERRSPPAMTDTKALIERLMKGCDCEKCKLDACCCPEMEQAAQALRDLTAENERLMGLVKEAGEALEDAHYELLSADATILKRSGTRNQQRTITIALCNYTLAKIKEATDAG